MHVVAAAHIPDLTRLQMILDQQAEQYNTTLSLGIFHQKFGAFGVASGFVTTSTPGGTGFCDSLWC